MSINDLACTYYIRTRVAAVTSAANFNFVFIGHTHEFVLFLIVM